MKNKVYISLTKTSDISEIKKMGSYAYTTINNYELTWSKDYFDEWFFHKNDRIRLLDKNGEVEFIGYKVDLPTLKIRLELAGYDINFAQKDFEDLKRKWLTLLFGLLEYDTTNRIKELDELYEKYKQYRNILEKITFEDWVKHLPSILSLEISDENTIKSNDAIAYTLKEIVSFFEDYVEPSASSIFPCYHIESIATILIEIEKNIGFCEADLTDLYYGGWIDDFHDIAQVQKQKTYTYQTFEKSIMDLYELKKLQINNSTFNNMLLGNAVSAMEAYLFDTFKKQVIERESITRRYVELYDNFNNKANIKPENLFKFLDNLDEKISNEIDRLSFHNINLVKGLYEKILCCSFEKYELNELRIIITQRHDIVHRNGKTISGDQIQINTESLEKYVACISDFIKYIDQQIVNNLLDD